MQQRNKGAQAANPGATQRVRSNNRDQGSDKTNRQKFDGKVKKVFEEVHHDIENIDIAQLKNNDY